MVAFIALIPTIRGQIPHYPEVVFIERLVYLQVLANFIGLFHSFKIEKIPD
jgi:hypothetical protein